MTATIPPDRLNRLSRREVVAGLAMMAAAGTAVARKPDIELNYLGKRKLDQVLPERVGRWKFVSTSGLIVPPEDQLALALYAQTVTRVYDDGSTPIMLLLAYSPRQNGFLQVHRPEFCYTAAGFALSDFATHEIKLSQQGSFRVNTLSATRDERGEKLMYWVRIGNHIPLSWAQQKLVFAEENLRKIIPDSILVRVSTPLGHESDNLAHMEEFVRTWMGETPEALRRVFVA
jgi:EpsI family protein